MRLFSNVFLMILLLVVSMALAVISLYWLFFSRKPKKEQDMFFFK